MAAVKDSFVDLERHRLLPEDTIKSLRKALQHWRVWDAEYEALKEEVDALGDGDAEVKDGLMRIQGSFEGELVDGKEVAEILGQAKARSKDQVVNVLDRRIDYVSKSIASLEKQLETAENKYAAASVISQPDGTDEDGEDGQLITEIVEELDDEDNVLSYRLNRPDQNLSHVKEALEKAGVKDLPSIEPQADATNRDETSSAADANGPGKALKPSQPAGSRRTISQDATAPKKSVAFAEDTTPETEPATQPQQPVSRTARRVEHIMKTAKEQENISIATPTIPDVEDPEDAALRQDMLRYGMGEVGAVVAELQLEHDFSDDEEVDLSDEDMDDDDDEDKYGRTKGGVVTDDYRQRMLELEKKLGISSRFTQANEDEEDSGSDDERVGRIVVKHNEASISSASKEPPAKSSLKEAPSPIDAGGMKGVRFAQELDIAPENDQPVPESTVQPSEDIVEPLSDIVERSAPASSQQTRSTPQKTSRFKKARVNTTPDQAAQLGPLAAPARFLDTDDAEPTPTGPEGQTIADTLVERDTSARPAETGEFGDSVFQEVASEHQRLRKKFIHRDGGFLKEDEEPIQPLNEDGEEIVMSRFKAARLSRQ